MRLYSWHAPVKPCANIHPMSWCDFSGQSDPAALAKSIVPTCKANPNIPLFLFNVNPGIAAPVTEASLLAGPVPVESAVNFMSAFYAALKSNGIKPSMIATDLEIGASDFNFSSTYAQADTCAANVATSIRRSIAWPLWDIYREFIPVVNYGDCVPVDAAVVDPNNWQYAPTGSPGYSVGGLSALSIYDLEAGNRWKYGATVEDVAWNYFIANINNIRACGPASAQLPWLSYPRYCGDTPWRSIPNTAKFLFAELLKHFAAMGGQSAFYWNPLETQFAADDQYAQQCIGAVNKAAYPALAGVLPQIPMDADSVVTGDVTTQYAAFLAALASDGQQPTAKNP